ncbi:MAG: HEAT repeat domain-containing protein [Candidatus Hydrogenedentes bacterium]|nr:HEAT repeat domain-containing protein [Candidatus Hydrogenedentota bacterium]
MKHFSSSGMRRTAIALGLFCLAALPAFAQRSLLNVPEPNTEAEMAAFTVADGFEVNLFAADPMIANPIHMNWDEQGRLWVVGSTVYPQIAPGEPTSDRITILEDTDHDGRADTSTIFADDLFIPTGIAPGDGGVYIANSTEILFLKDTDGDGRADRTRVVLSGFGTEDTHQIIHSPRWGYDGLLYLNQSIYIHSHIETPHGVRRLNAGGIWAFRPETMELEVFVRGFVNPWGHHFDPWGQSFATDGAYHEGINYVFPGAAFITVDGVPRILKGLNEGMPKHCSLEVLSGSHLPEDWRGSMITNDFRGQRVCRFVVTEEEGGYVSVQQPEVLKSTHVSFRPVDVRMGADGAIYIADWYDPIIQHGEVDFRDPRRDHEHGRIWRITAKGRPLITPPAIAGAPIHDLIAQLRQPEQWNRVFAKRELKTRNLAEVLPALEKALAALNPADADYENARLELLWAWQTIDVVNPALLDLLLASPDHHVRAAAIRVLSQWKDRLNNEPVYLSTLSALALDPHYQVQLEAVRALARVQRPEAADAAIKVMEKPMNTFLEYALWTTMRDLKGAWLPLVDGDTLAFAQKNEQLLYALKAVDGPDAVQPLLRLYLSGGMTQEQRREALVAIANHGSAPELGHIATDLLGAESQDPAQRAEFLQAFVDMTKTRSMKPEADLSRLAELIGTAPPVLRVAAINAAGVWHVEEVRPQLETLARANENDFAALRQSAINAIAALGGDSSRMLLESLIVPEQGIEVRVAAVKALLQLAPEVAAQKATVVLAELNGQDPAPIFQAFLQADNGVATLTAALQNATIPAQVAKLGERIVSSSGRTEPELLEVLRKAGGLGAAPTELSPERMAELVHAVRTQGDPNRGYEHYRKLDCAQCHAIAGGGGNLGPDMTSIGGSAQPDYLIDSLLLPGKAIKEGFHSLVVNTNDLETYSGIKIGETDRDLLLRSATEPEIRIPIENIESETDGGSLMPTGLTETLLDNEFIDLVAFLSELGRTQAFSAGTERHVRTWRVLSNTDAAVDYLYEARPEAALKAHDTLTWVPAYSHVGGAIPLDEVPVLAHRYWVTKHSFLQFIIDAGSSGEVALAITPREGTRLWVNGQPIELNADVIVTGIPAGQSNCTLILDRSVAQGDLDVRLVDDPRATVTAKFLGGR